MNNYVVSLNGEKDNFQIKDDKIISAERESKYSFSPIGNNAYHLRLDDKSYEITLDVLSNGRYRFFINGNYYNVTVRSNLEEIADETMKLKAKMSHSDSIKSPMPGLVLKVNVKVGDKVSLGDSLFVLEAMKMENDIKATSSGIIKNIAVAENAAVEKDQLLAVIG